MVVTNVPKKLDLREKKEQEDIVKSRKKGLWGFSIAQKIFFNN